MYKTILVRDLPEPRKPNRKVYTRTDPEGIGVYFWWENA